MSIKRRNMMMMSNNNYNKLPSLKKTTSFPFKNTSMDNNNNYYNYNHQHHHQPRKSPHQIEFPTSPHAPQLQDDGFYHFSHPQHPISQTQLPDLFTCSACKEFGAGERFACSECDFQLHDFCALAPEALTRHPIHPLHKIIYFAKPVKGGILKSKCDICAKSTKGCVFKCTVCSFQMHPCCAMLSTELNIQVHPHTLRLLPMPQYTSSGDVVCGECNKRRSGRVYHCTVCDYHLHAVCAKNMVNGLQANGIKAMDKPSMFGAAAKVATKVMIDFIGGLIEGLGEGVGQVLIQTAARGRCYIRSSARTS